MNKKIGLIGAGGFGARHLSALMEYGAEVGLALAAVADPTELPPKSAEDLRRFSIPRYTSDAEMYDRETLDGVIIAAPIPYHYDLIRQALDRSLPVYVEKPPVVTLEQLEELIAHPLAHLVQVGFQLMSWPSIRELLDKVRNSPQALRRIRLLGLWPRSFAYYGRAAWAGRIQLAGRPVFDGPAMNALAHYVHLLAAVARAGGAGTPVGVRGEFYRAVPIESYDTCSLVGSFENGPEFSVALSHVGGMEKVTQLVLEFEADRWEWDDATFGEAERRERCGGLEAVHRDFGQFLRGERTRPAVTLSDCRDFLTLLQDAPKTPSEVRVIPEEFTERIVNNSQEFLVVKDLPVFANRCSEKSVLFSGSGAPWAV